MTVTASQVPCKLALGAQCKAHCVDSCIWMQLTRAPRVAGQAVKEPTKPVLQVDVPVTASQVPGALEVVAQRKAHYLEKRRRVQSNEEVQVCSRL